MCSGDASPGTDGLTRRRVLAGMAAAAGGVLLGRVGGAAPSAAAATAAVPVDLGGVGVIPRSEWGSDLSPTGPIGSEPDVRYLLVHHSADPGNDYQAADVPGILRGFVRFHTSPAKGWPDLAYNFLVDRFGRVWEGRTGSLAAQVAGDATGGNQGFDQLCCFIGNHQAAEPSPEAFAVMGRLLGALAARAGIAVGDGATATFTSRGSNRHPAGKVVTTPIIAGHRDMSSTQCPGDRVFARLPELRLLATSAPGGASPATTTPPATTPPPTTPATTSPPPTAAVPPSTSPSQPAATIGPSVPDPPTRVGDTGSPTLVPVDVDDGPAWVRPVALAAGTAAAAAAATGAVRAYGTNRASVRPDAPPERVDDRPGSAPG